MHLFYHFGSLVIVIALSVCVFYNSIENDFAFDGTLIQFNCTKLTAAGLQSQII